MRSHWTFNRRRVFLKHKPTIHLGLALGVIYGWGKLPPAGIAQVALSLVLCCCVPAVANAEKRFVGFDAPQLGHFGGVLASLAR